MCWMFHIQLHDKDYNEDGGGDSKDGVNGVGADEAGQEGHESSIFTIAFSPNGKLLVTGGQDGFCRLVLCCSSTRVKNVLQLQAVAG